MRATILIIEDESLQLQVVCDILETAGYVTVCARDGTEGLRLLYQYRPDLVILDVMMPGLDGWEVCRRIRELSSVPIIFITVKGSDEDRVKGLQLGADDYLVKPFVPEELRARVVAVLRRMRLAQRERQRILSFANGELVINLDSREVIVGGEPVALTPAEFRLLVFLAERAGRALSTDVLADELWGDDFGKSVESLRWHIWQLRRKVEKDPSNPKFIRTERGIGYRFSPS